ncbi:MAG: hypothetical protein AAB072_02190 [Nitrospirota bacterium]
MGRMLASLVALTMIAVFSTGTYLHAQETAPATSAPVAPAAAPTAPAVSAPAETEKKVDGEKEKKGKKGKKAGKGKKKGKEKKNG